MDSRAQPSASPDLATREGATPFASTWRRQHLTADERMARGRAARHEAPRSSHGRWEPAPDRPDPVALLEEQAATRVPELVPIRYGRMLVSPFTFYRGGALIMAADLAATPVSGVTVQLCGDAHLSNFGLFGSPERRMLFDINDFDETLPGPWEWDVKRLAASFEVMGRDRGFAPADRRAVVMAGVAEYRDRMRRAAGMRTLDAWYEHLEAGMLLKMVHKAVRVKRVSRDEARVTEEMVAKARTRDSTRVFAKRADEVDGELRIVADPPIIIPLEDLIKPGSEWENPVPLIKKLLSSYRRTLGRHHHPLEEYRYVHSAYKMVGVGSVGTRCYIMLMLGRDHDDPLFLQVKEAEASVLERFLPKSTFSHHGERVVAGQRLMQAATDIFLGWQRIKGLDGVSRDYYVRQFQDWKGSADVESLLVPGATLYSRICGATLARAHARWGDRIAIASYLGGGDTFDRAIADFSVAYADQTERDYAAFRAAVDSGRLVAQVGL
jgi:uncharacterized protein (DUF2252 family)